MKKLFIFGSLFLMFSCNLTKSKEYDIGILFTDCKYLAKLLKAHDFYIKKDVCSIKMDDSKLSENKKSEQDTVVTYSHYTFNPEELEKVTYGVTLYMNYNTSESTY